MRFRVFWSPEADQEILTIWAVPGRWHACRRAARAIDKKLRLNPHKQGESRPGGTRILFEAPLAVLYQIDRSSREVTIVHVWYFRPSGSR